jgi:selenocysteine-specific elongation factor
MTDGKRRFVIGTAGHVDHGKTTLVRALTGVDTDRLPEEKQRGITIELGFARWDLGDGVVAGVVDVPGHRRLVHTMIAGAVGMELVMLVVAADEGVMPQTREHVAACELLGITRAVVVITKVDRVERELAELAAMEVSELLGERIAHEVVYVSARTGEGLSELTDVVRRVLVGLAPPSSVTYAELAVDRAFSVKGAGTVVTGTLARGALSIGRRVFVVGPRGSAESAVRGLHVHDRAETSAVAPTRLAINLAGLDVAEVSRGDRITESPHVSATRRFDASVRLLRPIKAGAELEVYVGTARTHGRLQILATSEELAPASAGVSDAFATARSALTAPHKQGPALGRVRLKTPLPVLGGDRFILRVTSTRSPSGAVVAGGVVLDASPPPLRSKSARRVVLEAATRAEPADLARALLAERSPRALTRRDLAGRFALLPETLMGRLEKAADRGEIARLKDESFVEKAALAKLAEAARVFVAEHHQAAPLERGIKLETLRQRVAARTSLEVAHEAIRQAARKGGTLVVEGDIVRAVDFAGGDLPAVKGPAAAVLDALLAAGLKGSGEHALLEGTGLSTKELRTVLSRLVKDGVVVVAGEQWFDARAVAELRRRVIAHYAVKEILTIAEFKELSGLGRKQAIPLLELLDREGVSIRRGDDRARGPRAY